MALFDSIEETTKKAADLAEDYVKSSRAYVRLKLFQQLTITISLVAKIAIVGSLLFIAAIFIATSLVILIGNWLGNIALGCLVVAVCSLIAAFVIYKIRKKIDTLVIKKMSPKFFDMNKND